MSSRKAAATKARSASSAKPKPVKPVAAKPKVVAGNGVSADAIKLAAEIERWLAIATTR